MEMGHVSFSHLTNRSLQLYRAITRLCQPNFCKHPTQMLFIRHTRLNDKPPGMTVHQQYCYSISCIKNYLFTTIVYTFKMCCEMCNICMKKITIYSQLIVNRVWSLVYVNAAVCIVVCIVTLVRLLRSYSR